MKINSILIRNFKGIHSLDMDFRGNNISIYGDNGTGKTTIADAISWLLFDKGQDFGKINPKPLDANGAEIHNLETSVEIDMDGKVFKKIFREKWTKKRGSPQADFTGHTTDYLIDGVPMKLKEWTASIEAIAPEKVFKLLTSPFYFASEMKWQDRRELLLEICGEISDAEIMGRPELARLPVLLAGKTPDDYRKIVMARRTEINRELTEIPARIDELKKQGNPQPYDEALIVDLKWRRDEALVNIQTLERMAHGVEKNELSEIEDKIDAIKKDIRARQEIHGADCHRLAGALADTTALYRQKIGRNKQVQEEISRYTAQKDHLRDEYKAAIAGATICPSCGQNLPPEKRSALIASINEQGKTVAGRINQLTKELNLLNTEIKSIGEQVDAMEAELKAKKAVIIGPIEGQGYEILIARQKQLEAIIKQPDTGEQMAQQNTELETVKKQLEEELEKKRSHEALKKSAVRISELETREKQLNEQWEETEEGLYLLDQFTRLKVQIIDEKISQLFDGPRFKMFDMQVNGGLNPCCEVTWQGVPFGGGLNRGAQINCGLAIIRTLQGHYGHKLPVIVDNAEAVTRLFKLPDTQIIRLVVSEADKCLRMEKNE